MTEDHIAAVDIVEVFRIHGYKDLPFVYECANKMSYEERRKSISDLVRVAGIIQDSILSSCDHPEDKREATGNLHEECGICGCERVKVTNENPVFFDHTKWGEWQV